MLIGKKYQTNMKRLIRKVLREQSDAVDVPADAIWKAGVKTTRPIPSKTIFFKVVKQIALTNPGGVLNGTDHGQDDRSWEMNSVLKLFGVDAYYLSLSNKIFWAAYDNLSGLEDGSINSFDELKLRPLTKWAVEVEETWTEHVNYYWSPIVEAYSEDDAANIVQMDEDGFYQYWEWESEAGFQKEYGETDSDGKEVMNVKPASFIKESRMLKENESPDENELVDGLRNILNKQKESHSEDVWYGDITKLFKRLNIPLKG